MLDLLKIQRSRLIILKGKKGAGKTLFLRYFAFYFGERELFRGISLVTLKDIRSSWNITAVFKEADKNLANYGVSPQDEVLVIFDNCELILSNTNLNQCFNNELQNLLRDRPKARIITSFNVGSERKIPKFGITTNEFILDFPLLTRANAARVLLSKCFYVLDENYRTVEKLAKHEIFDRIEFLLSEINSIATRLHSHEKGSSLNDIEMELKKNRSMTVPDAFTVALT
jgi:hypothetical protein